MRWLAVGQEAEGIVAIGQVATGVVAIGQVATGVIAVGQLARGVFAFGMVALGVVTGGMMTGGLVYGMGAGIASWAGNLGMFELLPFGRRVSALSWPLRLVLLAVLALAVTHLVLVPVGDTVVRVLRAMGN